ncbi:MAG: TolC family protein [Candidatus Margulisiibacteriota bacterium]|jgi:outer membrane protein TolC
MRKLLKKSKFVAKETRDNIVAVSFAYPNKLILEAETILSQASKIVVSLLLIFFLTGQAFSLTWREALELAPRNSNEIKSARKQLEVAQWTYYKSYSGFLPQVSASLSTGQSENSSGQSTSYTYGLNVSQALFKGFSNYYNVTSANASLNYYQASLQFNEADYYYQLRQAYVNLYISQRNLSMLKQIRESRSENARMIKLLYDSGKEDNGNYLRTQAQLKEADYNVVSAGRQLELTRLKLAQILNADAGSAESVNLSAVETPDYNALLKAAPAYKIAKSQLEISSLQQQSTISEFLPSISLQGSYSKSGSSWPPDSSNKSLSLSLSYSLFPGGSNIADRVITNAQYDKAKEDYAKTEKDLFYTLKQNYLQLQDAVEDLLIQQEYLAASTERSRIAQVKYLNGLVTYTEWDQIQNEYISAQNSLLNANKSALLAEASWYKSFGGWIK